MMAQFQGAMKSVDNKTNTYQNAVNRLQSPKELDVERLKSLTSEPTKKPLYDFIIENYEEQTVEVEDKSKTIIALKENITTDTLDKMAEIFKALGYFEVNNILKSKASDGLNSLKKGIFG